MASRSKRVMAAALSAVMITSSVPQLTSVVGYAAEETVTLTAPSNVRGYYNSIIFSKSTKIYDNFSCRNLCVLFRKYLSHPQMYELLHNFKNTFFNNKAKMNVKHTKMTIDCG